MIKRFEERGYNVFICVDDGIDHKRRDRIERTEVFDLRDRYRSERLAQQERLESAARRSRSRLVQVSTAQEPISFLRNLYRGR